MSDAPHTADLGTRYRYRQEGTEAERERIVTILNQLESEWRIKLREYMQTDNNYEIARYRNYILAVADLRDAVTDPELLIKGEKK